MFASQRKFSSARGGKSGRELFLVVQRHFLHNNKRLNVEFFTMFASLICTESVQRQTHLLYKNCTVSGKWRRQLFAVHCCCNFFQILSIKQPKQILSNHQLQIIDLRKNQLHVVKRENWQVICK